MVKGGGIAQAMASAARVEELAGDWRRFYGEEFKGVKDRVGEN